MKSITELFRRNSSVVPIPSNDASPRDLREGTGSWVTTSEKEGDVESYKDYLATSTPKLSEVGAKVNGFESEEDYSEHIKVIQDNLKIVSDTLGKYEAYKNDKTGYMSLFGGLLNTEIKSSGKTLQQINEMAGKYLGFSAPSIIDGSVVPLPGYLSYEDNRLVSTAITAIQSTLKSALGGRPTPNYELLFTTMTNGSVINGLANALTGDYFKKEFEKGRLPWQLPDDTYNSHSFSIYSDSDPDQGGGGLWSAIKGIVKKAVGDYLQKQDSNAATIIYGKQSLDSTAKRKYAHINDPYKTEREVGSSMSEIYSKMSKEGYLTGYKDFAGFEIGTNHNWRIKIRPYHSNGGGRRSSCTPPLPLYPLPNLFGESTEIESTLIEDSGWGNLINKWTQRTVDGLCERLVAIPTAEVEDQDKTIGKLLMDALGDAIFGKDEKKSISAIRRWFDYSENTPVLSYDLNFGTIRTESMRLFNGSSMEVFAGMQYNATMNLSILDDAYNSMYKYMIHYINSVYDINTSSMAPYYDMAFEIELIIFRTGNQVNHSYRFIGIPIEFTPRLEGSQEANECRVDMTFGIIGLIPPSRKKDKVYLKGEFLPNNEVDRVSDGKSAIQSELTWDDIMLHMGTGN